MIIHRKFKPLFDIPKGVRYFILTGGRYSFKSFSVGVAVCNWAVNSAHRILYTRYTLISAKDSIIPEIEEKIDLLGYNQYLRSGTDRIMCRHNKGKIVFKGIKTSSGNQTANLKSLKNFSCWILEEAEEQEQEKEFDKINLSIRSNDLQNIIVLILNPTTKEHWVYNRFFIENDVVEGFNGIKGDTCYIHSSYLDMPELVPEDIRLEFERMQKQNPDKYNHIVMGGWLDKAEGLIFDNWEEGGFDISLPYGYGLDFGYSIDPDALVRVAIDSKRKRIYLKEEMYKNGQGTNELADGLTKCEKQEIIADCAEPRLIDDLSGKGGFEGNSISPLRLNIKRSIKGQDSVKAGIKIMLNYRMIIHPDSVNLKKELKNYAWDDKRSEKPIDKYNHLIDAARYYVYYKLKGEFNAFW